MTNTPLPLSLRKEAMRFVWEEEKTFLLKWVFGLVGAIIVALFIGGALFPEAAELSLAPPSEAASPDEMVGKLFSKLFSLSLSMIATYLFSVFYLAKLYPKATLRASVRGFFFWLWGIAKATVLMAAPLLGATLLSIALVMMPLLMGNEGPVDPENIKAALSGMTLFGCILLMVAGAGASAYIMFRFTVLTPILLFGTHTALKVCWCVTKGRVWRLFVGMSLFWIQIWLYSMLLFVPALLFVLAGNMVVGLPIYATWVDEALSGLLYVPFTAIFNCVCAKIFAEEDKAAKKNQLSS